MSQKQWLGRVSDQVKSNLPFSAEKKLMTLIGEMVQKKEKHIKKNRQDYGADRNNYAMGSYLHLILELCKQVGPKRLAQCPLSHPNMLDSNGKQRPVPLIVWLMGLPLEEGFKVDKEGFQLIKGLLEAGVDPNHKEDVWHGSPALIEAARSDAVTHQSELIHLLLRHGAHIDAQDHHGWSALHHAAADPNKDKVVKMLCQIGARQDRFTTAGNASALQLAAATTNARSVEILLEAGADVDHVGQDQKTALYAAIRQPNIKVIEALIRGGANINHKDHAGVTPLMWAALTNNEDAVDLLLQQGASFNDKSNEGRTALDYAEGKYGTSVNKGKPRIAQRINEIKLAATEREAFDKVTQQWMSHADEDILVKESMTSQSEKSNNSNDAVGDISLGPGGFKTSDTDAEASKVQAKPIIPVHGLNRVPQQAGSEQELDAFSDNNKSRRGRRISSL